MSVEAIFDAMPYAKHLGMELEVAEDGVARARLPLSDEHSSVPGRTVAHGGVVHSLADHTGGAAVISLNHKPTPTIDIRVDHLAPATTDLVAEAEVVRNGGSVAAVDVEIDDVDGTHVARARVVYKTGGGSGDTAWLSDGEGLTERVD